LIVDNTVATPVLLNPIKHGAKIGVHSLTIRSEYGEFTY